MTTAYELQKRSLRAQLQNALGDRGEILPHQKRGTFERPARGWYAKLVDGSVVFLGDHTMVAAVEISKLNGA
jgi:hypothetical protein